MTSQELFPNGKVTIGMLHMKGASAASAAETLRRCDWDIAGSWFKDEHDAFGDVDEDYAKELAAAARG